MMMGVAKGYGLTDACEGFFHVCEIYVGSEIR
jgi:hypothetical protein